MFTLEWINEIHERFGKADTLPQYLRALKAIGVDVYDLQAVALKMDV